MSAIAVKIEEKMSHYIISLYSVAFKLKPEHLFM